MCESVAEERHLLNIGPRKLLSIPWVVLSPEKQFNLVVAFKQNWRRCDFADLAGGFWGWVCENLCARDSIAGAKSRFVQ